MKNLFFSLFILLSVKTTITSQTNATVCLGQDVTVCPGQSVTINDCNSVGGGAGAGTAPYLITTIPYAPNPFNQGTPITLSDDAVSPVQNIGFSFCFFGNTYTQFYIGSNGWVGFTAGQTTAFTSAQIPSTAASVPKNCIMAPWQDWHPGTGSGGPYIRYQTLGTAPNRRLVVSWNNVPMFSCTSTFGTFQIVLYETSNVVETFMMNKPNCTGWAGGTATHGLHNLAGNVAVVVPGRNSSQWTTTNDARRFTPVAQWANTAGQTFPYNNGTLNIPTPPAGTTGYFLRAGCSTGNAGSISDTTWVTVVNPTVNVQVTNDACTQSVGTATAVTPTTAAAPLTYTWSNAGGNVQTINNLAAGTYTVTVVDGNGCVASGSGTVVDQPVTFSATSTTILCAGTATGTATAVVNPASPIATYIWSNGQTTQTAVNLTAGIYSCTINAGGNCIGVVNTTVTQLPALQASIASQTNISCHASNNGGASINASGGTPPYSYAWNNSAQTTNVVNDLPPGANTVIVSDVNNCTQTLNFNLTQPNALSIPVFPVDTAVCQGGSITLNANGTGGSTPYTYTWRLAGQVVGTGSSITVTPPVGNNQYCLTLSEECGSPVAERCVNVIGRAPIVPNVAPNKYRDCAPGRFMFSNNSTNQTAIATTQYTFSNGSNYLVQGSESLLANIPAVGIYDVVMTVTSIYGCVVTDTFTNIVQVDPVPEASFLFTKNPVSWFEPVTTANSNSTGEVANLLWSSNDAISFDPTGESSTFNFPEGQTGIYPIQLIAVSPQGCRDTMIVDLIVQSEVLLYIPNTFTPDNDEHNQTWKFHIEGIDIMNFRVEIFNRWGEKIWESNDPFVEWDGTYGGYKVQKGTYTWKMTYKEKNSDGRTTKMGTLNVLR